MRKTVSFSLKENVVLPYRRSKVILLCLFNSIIFFLETVFGETFFNENLTRSFNRGFIV